MPSRLAANQKPLAAGQGVKDSQPRSWLGYLPVREKALLRVVTSRIATCGLVSGA